MEVETHLQQPASNNPLLTGAASCRSNFSFAMADALDLIETLQNLDVVTIASDTLAEHAELIEEKNREQLMEGKLSTGKDITPSYLDDPYFKSREAAQRYSDWKDQITPHPKRKKGTPNLFITGPFHQSIEFKVTGDEFEFHSSFPKAGDIERKFSEDIYGPGEEKMQEVLDAGMEESWQNKIQAATGLEFSK